MPCGGIPGDSVLTDKPAGTLFLPTPLGQNIHPGGGGSTPPLFPPVGHVCSAGGSQLGTPDFRNVPVRDGEEAKEVSDKVDGGSDETGILGVWYTADGGIFIPVLGTNVVVH